MRIEVALIIGFKGFNSPHIAPPTCQLRLKFPKHNSCFLFVCLFSGQF